MPQEETEDRHSPQWKTQAVLLLTNSPGKGGSMVARMHQALLASYKPKATLVTILNSVRHKTRTSDEEKEIL